jgi:hypothetical protein
LQGELPDWLLELSQSEEEEPYTAPLATAEEELADLTEEQETLPPVDRALSHKSTRPLRASTAPEESAQAEQEGAMPEWLDDLGQETETAEPSELESESDLLAVAESTGQADIPDWLRELGAKEGTETLDQEVAQEEEVVAAATGVDEPRLETPPAADQAQTMEATPSVAPTAERPAWLQELEAEIAGEEMPEEPSPVEAPEAGAPQVPFIGLAAGAVAAMERPEGLSTLDETTAPETKVEAPSLLTTESETPDWLQELERVDEMEEIAPPAAEQEGLSSEAAQEETRETIEEAELEPMPDAELPDWLQELRTEPPLTEQLDQTEAAVEPTPDEELPGWLQELRPMDEAQPAEAPAPVAETPPPEVPEPAELPAEGVAESAPAPADEMDELDWLQELERAAPAEEGAPERKPTTAPLRLPTAEREEREEAPVAPPPTPEPPAEPVPAKAAAPEKELVPEETGTARRLDLARAHLSRNALDESAREYERLVQEPDLAQDLIEELEATVEKYPHHSPLHRILGDAYMRTDRLQKALDAYRKALAKL